MNIVMATVGGSLAGGSAGAAALVLVANFPNLSHATSIGAAAGGFGIYLGGVVVGAFFGIVGGIFFGLVPTFVLGLLLTPLRQLPPSDRLAVWTLAGAIAGIAIHLWLPFMRPTVALSRAQQLGWLAAWAVGGATAMGVYWTAMVGSRRRPG